MGKNVFEHDAVNNILVELCNDVADHGSVNLIEYRRRLGVAVEKVTADSLPKREDLVKAVLAVMERVWDATYEGDEDGGAGDFETIAETLVAEFGFPFGTVADEIHRPERDEPGYTGSQWIRRCAVDGDEWPCEAARARGVENDAVAWHWNQLEDLERATTDGDPQRTYLRRMLAAQAGKADRRGRTLSALRDYITSATAVGETPREDVLLALLDENERVRAVIETLGAIERRSYADSAAVVHRAALVTGQGS